jgi:hypothetical protein
MSAVVLAAKYAGMKVDYRGMLRRAQCDLRKSPLSKFMLQELESHLTELGERYYSGDVAAVDEFLQLYCVNQKARSEIAGVES